MTPSSRPFTVCVFCSSSEAVAAEDRQVAATLGRELAARHWRLVYGGGNVGLMGEVARAALEAGAHVTGVIPHRLAERELAFDEVTELHLTETMRERKALMDERSDAFVVLTGGIGTLEELVEILTLRQLGYHERPIVLLDPRGFWDPLREQLARMVEEALAAPELLGLHESVTTVPAALAALERHVPLPASRDADARVALEAVEGGAEKISESKQEITQSMTNSPE